MIGLRALGRCYNTITRACRVSEFPYGKFRTSNIAQPLLRSKARTPAAMSPNRRLSTEDAFLPDQACVLELEEGNVDEVEGLKYLPYKAQMSRKALCSMVFGPNSLQI